MKNFKITQKDFIKANRRGSRMAELEDSTGFASNHKVHRSKKSYSRKNYRAEMEY